MLAVCAGFLSGCAQTVEKQAAVTQQVASAAPAVSGFMGSDLALLKPGGAGQAAMLYVNPAAQWKQYDKILLEPVQFWDAADSPLSPADQHMLTAYFYNALKKNLQKDFTLVDQGGPGVMVLQVAMVNAQAATPGLRSISVVVPQARVLNGLQSLASGSYAFVGSAEAEMKVSDAQTGALLAAAVDQRAGGVAMSAAAQWKWGDAENAMNYWAQEIASRLLQLQGRAPAAQ